MAKLTKKRKAIIDAIDRDKQYPVTEALETLKGLPKAGFLESVDVSINLGVDPRKSDQTVRGATVLPNGIGKDVRVAVFAQGAKAEEATAAGADVVGFDDLAAKVQGGEMDFDVVIATPDAMPVVGRLGQILGPKGLMPNPKTGSVTMDVTTAVNNAKAGQVNFRADKGGIVHASIGKADFEDNKLVENLEALIAALVKAKPAAAKGHYVQKVTLSTTMGPGLAVDQGSLS